MGKWGEGKSDLVRVIMVFELTKFKWEGFYSMIIKKKKTKEIINDYNNNNNNNNNGNNYNNSNTAVKEKEEKSVNKYHDPERDQVDVEIKSELV